MTCEQCHRREAVDGHLLCMICAADENETWDDDGDDVGFD